LAGYPALSLESVIWSCLVERHTLSTQRWSAWLMLHSISCSVLY